MGMVFADATQKTEVIAHLAQIRECSHGAALQSVAAALAQRKPTLLLLPVQNEVLVEHIPDYTEVVFVPRCFWNEDTGLMQAGLSQFAEVLGREKADKFMSQTYLCHAALGALGYHCNRSWFDQAWPSKYKLSYAWNEMRLDAVSKYEVRMFEEWVLR